MGCPKSKITGVSELHDQKDSGSLYRGGEAKRMDGRGLGRRDGRSAVNTKCAAATGGRGRVCRRKVKEGQD